MNFRQLEYVITIYREGTLTRAAEKLFISQPALTQQLRKLEKEIGTPLFDRTTTPLTPTYAGKHYLDFMEKILYENQQALSWLEDIDSLNRGKIVLGISDIRSLQFLPVLLPSFQKKYPHIEVEIKEAPALSLPDMVKKGEIDFALMIARRDHTGLTFHPLLTEKVLLAVPKNYEINAACRESVEKQGFIDLKIVKDQPFILLQKGFRLRNIAYELFQENGIMPPVVMKTVNVNLSHHMTSAGYGLSFVGEIAASLTQVDPIPCYYPVKGENCTWELGIAYHPEKYISKAMNVFFEHVETEVQHIAAKQNNYRNI